MIVGDYGGALGFATEPPFCTAYPLSFSDRDVPARMTFQHAHNHPWSFTMDTLLVRQLLARDCSPCEYAHGTGTVGAYSSLGVYISLPASFQRS